VVTIPGIKRTRPLRQLVRVKRRDAIFLQYGVPSPFKPLPTGFGSDIASDGQFSSLKVRADSHSRRSRRNKPPSIGPALFNLMTLLVRPLLGGCSERKAVRR